MFHFVVFYSFSYFTVFYTSKKINKKEELHCTNGFSLRGQSYTITLFLTDLLTPFLGLFSLLNRQNMRVFKNIALKIAINILCTMAIAHFKMVAFLIVISYDNFLLFLPFSQNLRLNKLAQSHFSDIKGKIIIDNIEALERREENVN